MPPIRRNTFSFTLLAVLSWQLTAFEKQDAAKKLKNLPPGENILWSDPGKVEDLDLLNGSGGADGAPAAPFQFVEEDLGGTTPKVKVRDAKGRTWSVKFGEEPKPSVLATRLVWACGYNVETEYFMAHGSIAGAKDLKRARNQIQGDGSFADARFQLRSASPKFLDSHNWSWINNPFLGTPQLNGLKVLIMLVSNWDTKDARDRDTESHTGTADSNLGIFQADGATGPKYLFLVTDWGASFGRWGSSPGRRSKFSCKDYAAQTPDFVLGADQQIVRFGYTGKHNEDIVRGIRPSDVQWLLQYLGQITDNQLRRGLAGAGGSPEEIDCFTRSIRQRIDNLRKVAAH